MKLNSSNSSPYLVLNDSELLFKMVFNQQFQFMAILSPEGRVLDVNEFALVSQGVSREDYVGKLFWQSPAWCNLPEWEDIWKQRLIEASNQQGPVITEDVFHAEDGSVHYADASTTAIYNPNNGQLAGYIAQAIDTTKRRLRENQIQENEARLEFVLEKSHIGNWELNLIDHTSHRSLKHDQIFGYDSLLPQWTYETFLEHVLQEDKADVEQKFQKAINNKTDWNTECRILRKDGEIRWILASGGHALEPNGQAKLMAGIVQDITELKQAEINKLSHVAELQSLFKALPDTYFRMMPDGTILDYHAQNQGDLYIKPENFLGKRMQDVLPQNIGGLFQSKIDEMAQAQKTLVFKYELIINNEVTHFDARLNRISLNDQLICVIRDVTEQNHLYDLLLKAQAQAKLGSWEQSFNNESLFWSNEVYRIFEYDIKITMSYEQFIERVHPEDRNKVTTYFQSSLENRDLYQLEHRLLFPDGRIKYVMERAEHFFDKNNKHIRSLGTVQDITKNKEAEKLLIASEERFKSLMHQSPATIEIYNTKGFLIDMNDAAKKMWKLVESPLYKFNVFASDEVKRKGHLKYLNEAYSGEVVNLPPHDFYPSGEAKLGEDRKRWVTTTIYPLKDTNSIVQSIVVSHVDITEQIHAEKKLHLSSRVFSDTHETIIITDPQQVIIDVNPAFCKITGYGYEEVIGKTPRIIQSRRHSPEFYSDMWQILLEDGYWSGEVWNRRKNGEVYAEMKTISAVRDEQGITTHYVALGSDITPMKQHKDQLEHIAHYDILTNLPNRVLLADRLSQAMLQCRRHAQSLAVVFLDLDGFKAVNDVHGHDMGDDLLISLSRRMKEALREGDSLARIGGDEFVAVLADLATVKNCIPVLDRLLLAASEPVTVGDVIFNVSASIGVTLYPQDNVDADQLMRHADQAMYVAKESGKNRYHLFDTDQDDAVKVQQETLEAIRIALDNQQFMLYYQPKVNMNTGKAIGVEALIRWQHPTRGLLNPIDFLPAIENNAMMIEIGEWVIDSALTQISQWQDIGLNLPLRISVNIAAVQLQQPNFVDRLNTLLAAHSDVDPGYLELEVLETSALDDVQHISKIMNACIAMGVNFALDDFGTGYSSLTYLRRLPANLIKIDQTFVRDMLIDTDDLAIVEGVIALAKSFKRGVIAEGVETIEHGTALLALGCDLAQGYGIAKPMPAGDFPQWCESWKPDVSWQN